MADALVIGEMLDEGAPVSRWRGGRIVTELPLRIRESVTSPWSAGVSVTLRLPGGVVGDVGQTVSGAPVFLRGETYLLFLQRLPDGGWTVLDMAAGMFPLRADPSRGLVVLPPRAEGISFVEPPSAPVVNLAPRGEPLAPLLLRLRRLRR